MVLRKGLILKKIASLAALSISAALLFTACGTGSTSTQSTDTGSSNTTSATDSQAQTSSSKAYDKMVTVNVGYMPNIHGASPLAVGIEKGYFEEYGIKVNAVKFLSGPPEFQAMASGDLDIGYIGSGATFLAAQGQGKIITIDNVAYSDSIIATKKSGITKIEDLKGKTMAVPKGTTGETLLNLAIEKAGMKASDININNMDVAGAVAAFVAGKVDAVAIWAPYTFEVQSQVGEGNYVVVKTLRDYPDSVYPSSWVARPEFAEKNKDVLVRFLKGWVKANDFRKANLKETAAITAKFTQVAEDQLYKMGAPEITDFYDAQKLNEMLKDGTVNNMYDGLIKSFVVNEKLKEYVDPKTFILTDPLNEALK